jgi:hypothetical protein
MTAAAVSADINRGASAYPNVMAPASAVPLLDPASCLVA